jgi:hypothetical protein
MTAMSSARKRTRYRVKTIHITGGIDSSAVISNKGKTPVISITYLKKRTSKVESEVEGRVEVTMTLMI